MDTGSFELLRWQDWAGHVCYTILALSYLVTNMWWLRTLAVVSLALEAVYFCFGSSEPLWVGMGWNAVFIGINLVQLALLTRRRLGLRFSEEEQRLHASVFSGVDRMAFRRLLAAGRWRELPAGTVLATEAVPVDDIQVISSGHAQVEVNRRLVALLHAGALVGEISLLTGGPASATVVTLGPCRVFSLPKQRLHELCARDADLSAAIHATLGRDVARKLRFNRLGGEAAMQR